MPKVSADYLSAHRAHILDAAATRFAEQGFHRSSMQDVINEAGLSPGAVYRYFRSKDDIIVAISLEAMALVETVVREGLESGRLVGPLIADLPAALLRQSRADDRMRLAVQAWGEALRNPTLAAAMQHGLTGVLHALSERVRAAQQEGSASSEADATEIARVLLALVQGFILQRCMEPLIDPDAFGRAIRGVLSGALMDDVPTQ